MADDGAVMNLAAYQEKIERLELEQSRRDRRLDIAPEHRPALWGEAQQANDDLGRALRCAWELLTAVKQQTERLAEQFAADVKG